MVQKCVQLHQRLRQLRRAFIAAQRRFDEAYACLNERQIEQYREDVDVCGETLTRPLQQEDRS